MRKILTTLIIALSFISVASVAQEKKTNKKKEVKSEKVVTDNSKKSCDMAEKKGSCCAKK
ncbi:MAG: hypothetical protein ACI9XR_000660 [Flavobacterium sp.]|jgi:hypothetical protein